MEKTAEKFHEPPKPIVPDVEPEKPIVVNNDDVPIR